MSSTPLVLLIVTCIALCVGLAGLITGGVGESWWTIESNGAKAEVGLWRYCANYRGTRSCANNKSILKFDDGDKKLSRILLSLIVSAVFALFAVISSLTMFFYLNNKSGWKFGGALAVIFSLLSAIIGLGGLVYAEIEFKKEWDFYDHGWSVISAWIGAIMCLIAFVLSIIMTYCVSPGAQRNVPYVQSNNEPYAQSYNGPYAQSNNGSYYNQTYNQSNEYNNPAQQGYALK